MNRRLSWIIATVMIAALVGWWVFILLKPSLTQPELIAEKATPKPSPTALPHNPPTTQQPSPTPDLSIYKTDPKWIWWNEQMERDRNFEWKMPISFYGKVVDQDDQPVEGAKVVLQWTDMSAKGTSERTIFTDSAGRFQLTGVSGKRLGVTQVFKDGYYRANKGMQTSFEYAAFFEPDYHQPDANNPVVFRLRKAGEVPSELMVRESLIGLPANGAAQTIDLRTGNKVAAGDVRLSVTRGEPNEDRRYDWK